MRLFLLLFFSLSLFAVDATPHNLQKVSLQLLWADQFQFAGYYMAKEKGFYRDVGLEVELKPYKKGINIIKKVVSGEATFGVGRPSLIRYDSDGKDISLLCAIFQASPSIFITLASSHIKSIKDFAFKKMMQTTDLMQSASVEAILNANHVDRKSIKFIEHSSNLNDLINKKVDIYSGYISNEPFILKEKGIKYRLFSSKDSGFCLYSDILFTSHLYATHHHKETRAFKEASLKGWEYAFSHIKESVDVIYVKYNSQHKSKKALLFEAEALKKLAYYKTKKVGKITESDIQRIYDVYSILGISKGPLDVKALLFKNNQIDFSLKEREYLKQKGPIRFCTQPNSLPYSAIKDGKMIGIGADLVEHIEKETGCVFKLVPTKTWEESIQKIEARECDILLMSSKNHKRSKYIDVTQPYYEEPLVLVTQESRRYIMSVNSIINRKFSVLKGNDFIEYIHQNYPNIKLEEVKSTQEGLEGVAKGKYFAHIDILMSAVYMIQHNQELNLKINGQFPDLVPVSFSVRNDDKILLNIFNKIAWHVKIEDLQSILNKWISVNYTKGVDYWYFREIGVFLLLLLVFGLSKEYFLKKKNRELKALQNELVQLNNTLEDRVHSAIEELEKAQKVAEIGSWIYKIPDKKLRWSKQTYMIFQIDPQDEENLFELFQSRIHPDDKEMTNRVYTKSLKDSRDYSLIHRLLLPDGSIKYVQERCESSFDADGNPLISYGTVQDVTKRVVIEEELKKRDATLVYQSRLAQMGEMMSMIAHQWKQPLSAISATQISMKTAIELEVYDLSKAEKREEFLEFTEERLDKIALYVQNLSQTIKNFSEYYKPNKKAKEHYIDKLVENSYDLMRDSISAQNIEMNFDMNSKSIIKVYENELMQVVLNILNNASQQLKEKEIQTPKIDVRSYEEEDAVVLSIGDNAGGIAKEIISKIFDPYFSTKQEKNGTGLGLYMSRMIIEEHHAGRIEVHNSNEGAIFTIKIPKEKEKNA